MIDSGLGNHRQLRQWVVDRLRSDILEGQLKPGEWLRQERLAQAYGVSQTPVREALKQLAAEGFVEHVPYRGIRVVEFTIEDVEDLYSCRSAVEGLAARFAAHVITDPELVELRELQAQMLCCETPVDLVRYRELNRRFHEAISTASRRSYLMRTLVQLWTAFPTMLWSNVPATATTSVPGRDEPDAAEHAEIIAALEAKDPDRAEAAVRRHLDSACRALATSLKKPQ